MIKSSRPLSRLTTPTFEMEFFSPETRPFDRNKAIHELLLGRKLANQLKAALIKSTGDDDARELVTGIFNSFSNTLSMLNSAESDEVSRFPASTHLGSPCFDGRKSEDSVESCKPSRLKSRRGCYKRRRTSQSRTIDSPALVDDGHAWRKYGQKVILKSKYSRNYFRCTHKYEQGCQAIKHVQRIDDEPPLYRTTYYGHHTCKPLLKPSEVVLDVIESESSKLLSFTNHFPTKNGGHGSFLHQHQSLSPDFLLPSELSAYDHGDVISGVASSCTTSSHSFGMDIMVEMESVKFEDDVLQFPEFS
ncbi:hypothetical protein K2173_008176 [Erythroxylum novogranatense]|uniref:WRKY domain-containing protein n=1 Tax=Erythroxylum novogranatense TaxID=1862640 RepID=A0AAV8UC93_9ROSI|nr:hypothetical protein K2173_008176 [Erythroxylum novogranatense]